MREVREEALGWTWRVSRTGRRRAVALRVLPDGGQQELATSKRLFGFDRVGLAGAVLLDATDEVASHRLSVDLAAFLVPYEPGEQRDGRRGAAGLARHVGDAVRQGLLDARPEASRGAADVSTSTKRLFEIRWDYVTATADKLIALADAPTLVRDGSTLAIGGLSMNCAPMAFCRELVPRRTPRPDLVAIVDGMPIDWLVAAGCVRTLVWD